MRRRRRAPTTQMARAGQRTKILVGDGVSANVTFRARTLADQLRGTLEIETDDARRTQPLTDINQLDTTGLVALSLVPEHDTVVTFVGPERPGSPAWVFVGGVLFLGALAWTAWDILGL